MSEEDDSERDERASGLSHILHAGLPHDKMAPWMSEYGRVEAYAVTQMQTIADGGSELDRRAAYDKANKSNNGNAEPYTDNTGRELQRGAVGMFSWLLNKNIENFYNVAPGVEGRRAKWAGVIAKAQKAGPLATEPPKKRSLTDRLLGRNKEYEM